MQYLVYNKNTFEEIAEQPQISVQRNSKPECHRFFLVYEGNVLIFDLLNTFK